MMAFRYWMVRLRDEVIVVEWNGDAVVHRTEGVYIERGGYPRVAWMYEEPPEEIDRAALTILVQNNEHDVEGGTWEGYLPAAEVDDFVCAAGSGSPPSGAAGEGSVAA